MKPYERAKLELIEYENRDVIEDSKEDKPDNETPDLP